MDFDDNTVLIENLIKGEEKAYMFLLKKFHGRLYAYAQSLVNDRATAQDIVQNVFLKTWKFRKRLDPQFTIQSFLYKSVYNEFINNYQKNRAMMLLQQKYVEAARQIMEGTDLSTMDRMIEVVNQEIRNLPPKCQKVFVLSKKEGLTNIEISEYLNVSVKTVETQITKAYGILREKLGNRCRMILMIVFGVEIENPLLAHLSQNKLN